MRIIIAYLLLVILILFFGFTIKIKEMDARYQVLLQETNYQIRWIQDRGLITQYNWAREHKGRAY